MQQPDAHLTIPSPYYRVSLKALIFDDQHELLVIQTADGMWELPGGGWEHGETMSACLQREIQEELGVMVTAVEVASAYPYSARGRTGQMRLKMALPVTLANRDFRFAEADIQIHKYVSQAELTDLPMVESEAGIKAYSDLLWADQARPAPGLVAPQKTIAKAA